MNIDFYLSFAKYMNVGTLNFIDIFSGIGGIKLAFEKIGFKSVFSSDFDKNCKTTFDQNFAKAFHPETELFLEDIAKLPSHIFPNFNLLTGGFPCQPFSIAGYKSNVCPTLTANMG